MDVIPPKFRDEPSEHSYTIACFLPSLKRNLRMEVISKRDIRSVYVNKVATETFEPVFEAISIVNFDERLCTYFLMLCVKDQGEK
jgi:hypothetical protein